MAENKETNACSCDESADCQLKDVNLMRLAVLLRGVDLHVLCAVLLNDASHSEKITKDLPSVKADVKIFYVLQDWKKGSQTAEVTELRELLGDNLGDTYRHAICQALKEDASSADNLDPTIRVLNVYPEFLDAVANTVTYKYLQLGFELGFTLSDMERLEIENSKVLEKSRASHVGIME